ncbi:hypothetical protein TrispH2_010698 [Trichoplax sp. H2]|nr:hypothetical protein TrispH2_010698 [Trichoplax sp. H2]|eukprot:RDD38731.1 hypothetical protein TrispH2_010698 [Trichoplax sp. H2]
MAAMASLVARNAVRRVLGQKLRMMPSTTVKTGHIIGYACICRIRNQHTDVESEAKKSDWDLSGIKRWFGFEDPPIPTEEEMETRMELLERVREMYYAQPPISPDYEFYAEAVRAMIRFRDKRAVETICDMMNEVDMEIQDDLRLEVEQFLEQKYLEDYY